MMSATGVPHVVVVLPGRRMQLDDKCLGELLQAKESHQKPSQDHLKSQSTEYRRLYQQWDQLIVCSRVLW